MPFTVDIQLVKRAEVQLGRKLPHGYVARMCRDNGGEVVAGGEYWCLNPIFDDTDRQRLKRTCNDLVRETAKARSRPDFPAEALAIGSNGGGDLLILVVRRDLDRYGDEVFWWDHETGELNQVADTFEDLTN